MRRRALTIVLPVLMAAALSSGCAGQTPTVSGDVTLDGQPVAEGLITFVPADPQTANVARPIQNGKYSAPIPAGSYKVQINAPRATGQKKKMYAGADAPAVDVIVEAIPERYNTNTELHADIKLGDNKLDWPLKSK